MICEGCGRTIRGAAVRVSVGNIGPKGIFRRLDADSDDFFCGTCRDEGNVAIP